jgi:ElaB/YqjD/DUF883 family membrane-anchored ribosome-binding protein
MDDAEDAIRSAAADAAERGKEAAEQMQEVASNLTATLKSAIERQPLAAVAIAAAIGFVVGVLNRR